MDRISEFKKIKADINSSGKSTRDFIDAIVDELSFVEMDTYYKSNNEEIDVDMGEGVICGFARINDSPIYIFAQNFDAQKGLSKYQADKILKCMDSAEKAGYPLISVLSSLGAVVDGGLSSLEGYAKIIAKASSLYGIIPQISIIRGDCLGSLSYYAALSDFVFMLKDSVLCSASPLVIAAKSGKSNDAKALFGSAVHLAKTGLASRVCANVSELAKDIKKLLNLIEEDIVEDDIASLNKTNEKLNDGYNATEIINSVFDKNSFYEISAGFGGELICGLCKIGGLTAGAILSSDGQNTELTPDGCRKASKFIRFINNYNMPLLTFVNCEGTINKLESEQGTLIKDVANLMSAISDGENAKISVVCGNVAATGYTALASKSLGFNYSFAWANSSINLLPVAIGTEVLKSEQLAAAKNPKKEREILKENALKTDGNPLYAANQGFIDNIIEPANTRAYLLSVLLMLS